MTGSVSSPSFNGQVFMKLACAYEFIKLIPEAGIWTPDISRNACLLCSLRKKSPFFLCQWIMEE